MKLFSALRNQFFTKFYLMIPISIITLACIESFAIYFITIKGNSPFNFFQSSICVAAAMSYLAVLLGQFKKKILFKVLIMALLIETIFLIFNLAFWSYNNSISTNIFVVKMEGRRLRWKKKSLNIYFPTGWWPCCSLLFPPQWPSELLLKAGTVPIPPKYGFTTLGGLNWFWLFSC